ncbi:helix-turn-helix transcriptional regulator [Phreatobacter stygius]|uniref:YafY family transcriptional regulator n=1 Tax=Phreatobacter stygius TaxID=1940610 RepID=A0A4D7BHN6_9HYPH|nr:YafY family protein [Phreatobacter stygius]QCI67382.1 YafY family transcriptional regulator [Phreatobacter stygius]
MSKRSERLLLLMQALRRRRRPATGQVLADEMGISLRSLYRDIETLKSLGAAIDGAAGLGFQLRADYFMPPLMFSEAEVEALVLGLRSLIHGPDADMAETARDASAKIAAMLPEDRRGDMEAVGLFAVPGRAPEAADHTLADLRKALRDELQVELSYRDGEGQLTERTIHPVALGYRDDGQMLVAWCMLRGDYRRFRIERMEQVRLTDRRLPRPRRTLLHEWRMANQLPDLA